MNSTASADNMFNSGDGFQEDVALLQQKLSGSNVPAPLKEETLRSISRLVRIAKYGHYSGEFETIKIEVNTTIVERKSVIKRV